MPATCATDAAACGDKARKDEAKCEKPCNGAQSCLDTCQTSLGSALALCATACEGCAGCAVEKCDQLVGL
jgi:hypothetical protein